MSKENMVSMHITVEAKLKDEIQEIAKKDDRFVSVSHLSRVLLDHAVKEYKTGKV